MANSLVSGVVRRLLPITTYTFSGAQGSQNLSYTVAKHLELGAFTEATLLWRLPRHAVAAGACAAQTRPAGRLVPGQRRHLQGAGPRTRLRPHVYRPTSPAPLRRSG